MNLSEAEKRMIYQVEGTSQGAALNEIYMTWRYAPDKAMKDTAEGLLKKLRPLSDKECMDVIRDIQKNYRLPGKARTIGEMGYRKIITYILDTEDGASLRAAGWTCAGLAGGKEWTGRRKPSKPLYPAQMKYRYEKILNRKEFCKHGNC